MIRSLFLTIGILLLLSLAVLGADHLLRFPGSV